MEICIKRIDLPNGLSISVHDTTRRYYEDFHLVKLEFVCMVPLLSEYFDTTAAFEEARQLLGEKAVYRRTCEKMAVPFNAIDSTRTTIISDFIKNSLSYFSGERFPRKLARSELEKARKSPAGCGRKGSCFHG